MTIAGWDIGGANLKQATTDGRAWSVPFELWRRPDDLAGALANLLSEAGEDVEAVAVTMTGELADCFATKAEGVQRILEAAVQAASSHRLAVWSTSGKFLSLDESRRLPLSVAAANWNALATWCGRLLPNHSSTALLIDIGSTTTDIIPLAERAPGSHGLTDGERLQSGELLYTGVRRTPLCAVSSTVRWREIETPVAAELFATMLDVYLLIGDILPDANDLHTANGRPATVDAAHDRLARMLCCDRSEIGREEAISLAQQWAAKQQAAIGQVVRRVIGQLDPTCEAVILSGSGEFLARRVLDDPPKLKAVRRISLTDRLGPAVAESACAFAVANLLAGR